MSSTNRGTKRSEADRYNTPPWVLHRLLERVAIPGGRWLEPCAGQGNIIRAVSDLRSDVLWTAVELQEEDRQPLRDLGVEPHISSFFDWTPEGRYDAVITNPPYRLAQEFIDKCLDISDIVFMLLRLNFLGSERRANSMRRFTPDVYVLPNRPSFDGTSVDSCEYGWLLWHGRKERSEGVVTVLNSTSKAERLSTKKVSQEQEVLDPVIIEENPRALILTQL